MLEKSSIWPQNLPEKNIKGPEIGLEEAGRWQAVGISQDGEKSFDTAERRLVAGCCSTFPQERIPEHAGGSQEASLNW